MAQQIYFNVSSISFSSNIDRRTLQKHAKDFTFLNRRLNQKNSKKFRRIYRQIFKKYNATKLTSMFKENPE